jgi:hypothetical protein
VKQIDSQHRETLAESGYRLVGRYPGAVILEDKETGLRELWYANDDHAGYTVQVGRWGYEFGRDWKVKP